MRNALRGLIAAAFILSVSAASSAVSIDPSHHIPSLTPPSAMVTPNLSSCDFSMPTTFGNVWYFDLVNGQTEAAYTTAGISMDPTVTPHQGDAQHPWNSLQAVFQYGHSTTTGYSYGLWNQFNLTQTTLSPIHDVDEILLMNGDYGGLNIGAYNVQTNGAGPKLTIAPAPGQTAAIVDFIHMDNTSNIVFTGFTVQSLDNSWLIHVADNDNANPGLGAWNSHNIVFDHLNIQNAPLATALTWTQAQWTANTSEGVNLGITHCVSIQNSTERAVNTGLALAGGYQTQYINNDLGYFASDGIDFHDDDLLIHNNKIHDFINLSNGDHIDGMQGIIGVALFPVSHRIEIDSNYVVYQLDPNLPFVSGSGIAPAVPNGGIGMTNGIYENVYANNNIVVWVNVDGISTDGCSYCGIENNTVVGPPGVGVEVIGSDHVLVKNNLTNSLSCTNVGPSNHVAPNAAGTIQTLNNIIYNGGSGFFDFCVNGIQTHFSGGTTPGNYPGGNIIDVGGIASEIQVYDPSTFTYNFHLLPTAQAIGAGASVDFSPAVDSNGVPLNSPPDAGAVAFP